MKHVATEDVLRTTFEYLQKVLDGEVADPDGFIRRTARRVEQELAPAAEDEAEPLAERK